MKDVTGKPLEVGDKVVLIPQNGYTMSLSMGIIIGFTPQKVKIQLTNKAWSYSNDECLKFPEQVAKV
jgi:hypothetical protein